jgi:hypothetical protein
MRKLAEGVHIRPRRFPKEIGVEVYLILTNPEKRRKSMTVTYLVTLLPWHV